jgi:hypothetical protein
MNYQKLIRKTQKKKLIGKYQMKNPNLKLILIMTVTSPTGTIQTLRKIMT